MPHRPVQNGAKTLSINMISIRYGYRMIFKAIDTFGAIRLISIFFTNGLEQVPDAGEWFLEAESGIGGRKLLGRANTCA